MSEESDECSTGEPGLSSDEEAALDADIQNLLSETDDANSQDDNPSKEAAVETLHQDDSRTVPTLVETRGRGGGRGRGHGGRGHGPRAKLIINLNYFHFLKISGASKG